MSTEAVIAPITALPSSQSEKEQAARLKWECPPTPTNRLLRNAPKAAHQNFDTEAIEWSNRLDQVLQAIDREPALNLMVHRQS
jgi:hypothetical protein